MPALVVGGALVVALGSGLAVVATQGSGGRTPATLISTRGTNGTVRHHHAHALGPAKPISVLSISPDRASGAAGWRAPVTVRFSQPLATGSALPSLSPPVPGSWVRVGPSTVRFSPRGNYVPFSSETVVVPATVRSNRGVTLGHVTKTTFVVEGASVLRLQELLAELGYLPVAFKPGAATGAGASGIATTTAPASVATIPPAPAARSGGSTALLSAPGATATHVYERPSASRIRLQPRPGDFTWRFPNIPPSLAALWQAGQANVITTGAVMQFEVAHGMGADGVAGPHVWAALLEAAATRQVTTAPYDYVYVTTTLPEHVSVWRDGVFVFTTLANTGISQAPTQAGTWPVFARYLTTTMSGTNPDGSHYSDPGVPWVSYFHGGDALHGFIRPGYGYPQSLGCVEMTYESAHTVYPFTPLGTLVTVQ
jgi:peptidoglycan hydrolase-like protein with peptidoglycan-binding domain